MDCGMLNSRYGCSSTAKGWRIRLAHVGVAGQKSRSLSAMGRLSEKLQSIAKLEKRAGSSESCYRLWEDMHSLIHVEGVRRC